MNAFEENKINFPLIDSLPETNETGTAADIFDFSEKK